MDLKHAKVIITGATSGIGLETAKSLKDSGAKVLIASRSEKKVKAIAEEFDLIGYKCDVSNESEVKGLFEFAIKEMGSFNVLINNAGIGGSYSEVSDMSVENFQNVWEVNVRGMFLCGREAARHFKSQLYGNIINIGSTAALRGYAKGSAYVASKFAVSGLTECWRAELRPYNVRVMQVNPSEVVTEFFSKAGFEQRETEKKLKPSEIAHLIKSMLSMDDIGFIPSASVWATNPW